ncbi:hypothetical protein HNY73_011678 [Argiope bruennichi]|uniref:Uncharacterized protein n=1 Tax=Argiope bruennichi TaxID=94029 RepID=A0A8T0F519_ARGBR|nr:hypothetical protein HNY73_011678 [Argiope bruennichi]
MSSGHHSKGIAFRRKMVPRASSDGDHLLATNADSGDDKDFSDGDFKSGKSDVMDALIPQHFIRSRNLMSWTFDGDRMLLIRTSHRSLLEDKIVIT